MVTKNSVVDGEECLLTWKDNGKGRKVPLQPGIIQSWELSSVEDKNHLGFTVKLPAVGFIAAMYLGTV